MRRRYVIAGAAIGIFGVTSAVAVWQQQVAEYCEPELRTFSEPDVGVLAYREDTASLWACLERAGLVQHGVPHVARDDRGRALSGDGGKILIFK